MCPSQPCRSRGTARTDTAPEGDGPSTPGTGTATGERPWPAPVRRRAFLGATAALPTLRGPRLRRRLGPLTGAAPVAFQQSGDDVDGTGSPAVRTVSRGLLALLDPEIRTSKGAYVAVATKTRCAHDENLLGDVQGDVDFAEYSADAWTGEPSWYVDRTVRASSDSESPASDPQHAWAHASLEYELTPSGSWAISGPVYLLGPTKGALAPPVWLRAREHRDGVATAAGVAVFAEGGSVAKLYEAELPSGERSADSGTDPEDVRLREVGPETESVGAATVELQPGALAALTETSEPIEVELFHDYLNDLELVAGDDRPVEDTPPRVAADLRLARAPRPSRTAAGERPGLAATLAADAAGLETELRSGASSGTGIPLVGGPVDLTLVGARVAIRHDPSGTAADPGSPFDAAFDHDGDTFGVELLPPSNADPDYALGAHTVETVSPGESFGRSPPGLPEAIGQQVVADGESVGDDAFGLRVTVAGGVDVDRITERLVGAMAPRELAPGDRVTLKGTYGRTSKSIAFGHDPAALDWNEVVTGVALYNDAVDAIPLGLSNKTIRVEIRPTEGPMGPEPDREIVGHTVTDGRVPVDGVRMDGGYGGEVDYDVSLARTDAHAILESDDPGRRAREAWDAGRLDVRGNGIGNQVTLWVATTLYRFGRAVEGIVRFIGG